MCTLSLSSLSSHQPSRRRSPKVHGIDGANLEDYYELGEKLGEGGFGEVFKCRHRATGVERAVKALLKSKYDEEMNTKIRREFQIVEKLDHPNVIREYEFFEDDTTCYIVMDLYEGGELFDELEDQGRLSEQEAALLMNNILRCINYLHSQNPPLVHRDLKPENILLEASRRLEDVKIIDFGLATYYDPTKPLTEIVGSPYYLSPQVLQELPYGPKADVWSCGVILFIVLSGYCPFDGDTYEQISEEAIAGNPDWDDPLWDDISDTAKDFVSWLLAYDEKDRPTAQQALEHPFLARERLESYRSQNRDSVCSNLSRMESFRGSDSFAPLRHVAYSLLSTQLIDKEDREEIDQVFRVLDKDMDGYLTRDEVKIGYVDFFGRPLTDSQIDDMFERVNVSRTGAIEYSEFVAACLLENEVFLDDKKLRMAFEEFDLDGNGYISLEELRAALDGDFDVDEIEVLRIMQQVDKDGDGEIGFDEFKCMMLISASANIPTPSTVAVRSDAPKPSLSCNPKNVDRPSQTMTTHPSKLACHPPATHPTKQEPTLALTTKNTKVAKIVEQPKNTVQLPSNAGRSKPASRPKPQSNTASRPKEAKNTNPQPNAAKSPVQADSRSESELQNDMATSNPSAANFTEDEARQLEARLAAHKKKVEARKTEEAKKEQEKLRLKEAKKADREVYERRLKERIEQEKMKAMARLEQSSRKRRQKIKTELAVEKAKPPASLRKSGGARAFGAIFDSLSQSNKAVPIQSTHKSVSSSTVSTAFETLSAHSSFSSLNSSSNHSITSGNPSTNTSFRPPRNAELSLSSTAAARRKNAELVELQASVRGAASTRRDIFEQNIQKNIQRGGS